MAFQKKFGGGSIADVASAPPAPSGKKGKKPFGKKGSFQKKGFTPAMKSMRGGGRY
jgi:hypothetical protein